MRGARGRIIGRLAFVINRLPGARKRA